MGQTLSESSTYTQPESMVTESKNLEPELAAQSTTIVQPIADQIQTETSSQLPIEPVNFALNKECSNPSLVENKQSITVVEQDKFPQLTQAPLVVPLNLDTWYQNLISRLNSIPSEMFIVCSDTVLACSFDLESACLFAQQEAQKQLLEGIHRHKVETIENGKIAYSITIYERDPNLIFGRSVIIAQYHVCRASIMGMGPLRSP
jgi:hypothetical protein